MIIVLRPNDAQPFKLILHKWDAAMAMYKPTYSVHIPVLN